MGIPRGRGRVERFFSTVDQMFLCTLSGFKSSGGKKRLTLAEFDVLLREFILETYHDRLHGETGVAPIRRWEHLRERSKAVDQLLEIKRNDSAESDEHPASERIEKKAIGPRLKRYRNE